MKRIVMGMLVVGMAASLAIPAQAQNFPYALNIHFGNPPITAFACTPAVDLPDAALSCAAITVNGTPAVSGGFSIIWLVVSGVDRNPAYNGIGAVQFGINYTQALHANPLWNLCTGGNTLATSAGPNGAWPNAGAAAAMTWAGGCKNVTANTAGATKIGFITFIAGPFGPNTYSITEDPSVVSNPSYGVPAALGSTCPSPTEVRICRQLLGKASNGLGTGVNTCGFICNVPTEEQSWSTLKNIYN